MGLREGEKAGLGCGGDPVDRSEWPGGLHLSPTPPEDAKRHGPGKVIPSVILREDQERAVYSRNTPPSPSRQLAVFHGLPAEHAGSLTQVMRRSGEAWMERGALQQCEVSFSQAPP